jgi:phage baseplate assembly protein W
MTRLVNPTVDSWIQYVGQGIPVDNRNDIVGKCNDKNSHTDIARIVGSFPNGFAAGIGGTITAEIGFVEGYFGETGTYGPIRFDLSHVDAVGFDSVSNWNSINPLIESPVISSSTIESTWENGLESNRQMDTYLPFVIQNADSYANGSLSSMFAISYGSDSTSPIKGLDCVFYLSEISTYINSAVPYMLVSGTIADPGSPAYGSLTISTDSIAYIGDQITITAVTGEFNSDFISNLVTIGFTPLEVIAGDSQMLVVVIPEGCEPGDLVIQTFSTYGSSVGFPIQILFDDSQFAPLASTRDKSLDRFGGSVSGNAIYARDFAYSKFSEVTDENSIVQNVLSIVLTSQGERLFNPDFGSPLNLVPFSIMDSNLDQHSDNIISQITKKINRYEPRATVIRERTFIKASPDINELILVLAIMVPSGNVRLIGVTLSSIGVSHDS